MRKRRINELNTKKTLNTDEKILFTLQEILKWIKATSFQTVKTTLETNLDTDSKKLIYKLSDGNSSSTEIIKKAKASSATITKYWQEWEKLGLGENISVKGGNRFIRNFDPEDFGIDVHSTLNSQKKTDENNG